jgi:TonB family protein
MTSISEPASLPTDQKSALSKLNRKDTVQKSPAIPSPDPTNSSLADASDEIIVKKYYFQEEGIAKLKVFSALNKKKPQIKAFAKRSLTGPTMTSVSEQVSFPTVHRSAVSKLNLQGTVQKSPAIPRPDPTNSSLADTASETIVEKDTAHEAESAVEISSFLAESDEANNMEPDELVGETAENEANEEQFSDGAPPETTIALGSRRKDDGSAVIRGAGYVRKISPKYPERARREGWEGTTLLRVLVDRQGKSKVIQISQSSGFALLDGAALEAVEKWRFYPAKNGNGAVESWVRIPILFRLIKENN